LLLSDMPGNGRHAVFVSDIQDSSATSAVVEQGDISAGTLSSYEEVVKSI
jgi:hypothetical protein